MGSGTGKENWGVGRGGEIVRLMGKGRGEGREAWRGRGWKKREDDEENRRRRREIDWWIKQFRTVIHSWIGNDRKIAGFGLMDTSHAQSMLRDIPNFDSKRSAWVRTKNRSMDRRTCAFHCTSIFTNTHLRSFILVRDDQARIGFFRRNPLKQFERLPFTMHHDPRILVSVHIFRIEVLQSCSFIVKFRHSVFFFTKAQNLLTQNVRHFMGISENEADRQTFAIY